MSELQVLYQLQELDLENEAKNAMLQEIASALGETGELTTTRAQVDSLRELLHDQEQRLRELEWDSDELTAHIAKDEKKLYGGTIHNPKELEGLQKDLDQRRHRLREIEDRELQLMADVESTQADLERAQQELARVGVAWEQHQRELSARQADVNAALVALQKDRARITTQILPANLSQYEKLRREKRGRAVSKVERATCQGCRIALPMGLVQHARSGREIVLCPSCGRMLYAT
jgi:predicted  nucleic acid-binding Zn-ribbon protein